MKKYIIGIFIGIILTVVCIATHVFAESEMPSFINKFTDGKVTCYYIYDTVWSGMGYNYTAHSGLSCLK